MTTLKLETAPAFKPFLRPSRYKAAFGGRGSGKSRFFGGLLIEEHLLNPGLRSVCVREVQKTLKDSAKRLLEDELQRCGLGLAHGFDITKDEIRTPGNGVIIFQGMQDHNAESIKSLEGFSRCWVEEAQTLSAHSLELLRPTIRAPGSEIWFSWNPRRKSDPVDAFFRGEYRPTDAVIVAANWDSNPWFPAELEAERQDDLRINPDAYPHIWEGAYATIASGAYYAKALTQARAENRICRLAADPLMTYRAFFDIGGTGAKADACAIWIAQYVGREVRVLDYYEAVGQELAVHVAWLRDNGYPAAKVYLPHDGVKHDAVYNVTYESALRDAGFVVEIVPNQGAGAATQRIEAARRVFPSIWFDAERCAGGIDAIGWYHEKRDPNRQIGLGPEHDWSSHGADAFGMMCVQYEKERLNAPKKAERVNVVRPHYGGGLGWM